MGTWLNWAKKSSPGPWVVNTSSFQKWRNSWFSHSRTTKIYIFTHLDGKWTHEWIEPKKFPRSVVGENFNFFDFLKSFWKWRKSSYSHSRTSKIYEFTHLYGKWAQEWIEPEKFPRSTIGENFNFFDFLKSFRKWKKSSYSHSRTTKIYKFTHLDGELAHEWI